MNTIDLITILGNISQSLYPVQKLITGGAYILGVLFFITAIGKLKKSEIIGPNLLHKKKCLLQ